MIPRTDYFYPASKIHPYVQANTLPGLINQTVKEMIMWTKPQVTEMRFGFEVTMYVCNR